MTLSKIETAEHISGLIKLYGRMTLWAAEIHLRTWRTPGLRMRTRLGLTLPTPAEVRIIANMFRRVDFSDAGDYVNEFLVHINALQGKPAPTPVFDETNISQLSGEMFYKSMMDFADVYEQEPKHNLFGYVRATHKAQTQALTRAMAGVRLVH